MAHRVLVKFKKGGDTAPHKPESDYVVVEVSNVGKRSVIIADVGAEYLGGGGFVSTASLIKGSKLLGKGETFQVRIKRKAVDWRKVSHLWVKDASGTIYRTPVASVIRRAFWFPVRSAKYLAIKRKRIKR